MAVAHAKVLSQYMYGETEENQGNPPSGFPVSGPRMKPGLKLTGPQLYRVTYHTEVRKYC
jgi:hypothetical protein